MSLQQVIDRSGLASLVTYAVISSFGFAPPAVAQREFDFRPVFDDWVTEVTDQGMLVLENEGENRIWGLIDFDIERLREMIVGRKLRCIVAGETVGRIARVRAVMCSEVKTQSAPLSSELRKEIALRMIQGGFGQEYCQETYGLYQTCN